MSCDPRDPCGRASRSSLNMVEDAQYQLHSAPFTFPELYPLSYKILEWPTFTFTSSITHIILSIFTYQAIFSVSL